VTATDAEESPWPIPQIPALPESVYTKSILNLILNRMAGQVARVSRTPTGHKLFLNVVRLSDKATSEYQSARETADDFAENWQMMRLSPYFRTVDHLESCVNALHRALLHLDAIRSNQSLPVIDRTAWRSLSDAQTRLNDIRDAIEHTEERVRTGTIAIGDFPFLRADERHLELEGHQVKYSEMAEWLRRVHAIMNTLANDLSSTD
jgi:hypothetical protein